MKRKMNRRERRKVLSDKTLLPAHRRIIYEALVKSAARRRAA